MRKISLLGGSEKTLVSDEDFEHLNENIWSCNEMGYVVCLLGPLFGCSMHQIVGRRMDSDIGRFYEHLDGNKLNNRRENLFDGK